MCFLSGQPQKKKDIFKMSANKTFRIEVKLTQNLEQNCLNPQWILARTSSTIRWAATATKLKL
jgi:ribosomal protein L39E